MLQFLPTDIRFNCVTRAVHLIAEREGREIDVLVSPATIEYLAESSNLDKDESFTAVVRNKESLQYAAETALARHGARKRIVMVDLADLICVLPLGAEKRRKMSAPPTGGLADHRAAIASRARRARSRLAGAQRTEQREQ